MAFIAYVDPDDVPAADRVPDDDNILRIHAVNSPTIRNHYDLYRTLMYGQGPLTRIQREMIAVRVSALNRCRY
ncbi:MAG: carboxymuconolactone decarboxylase family protein [Gemmatimonadota bacterium]|nr:carboxymuconolactone decarboxylase family protein [Gemmatimonadota bacterium]